MGRTTVTGGSHDPGRDRPKALAFYLPQFHPIPENDEWWGPGFTEWHNVVRARPLYPGHEQPHVPGELGYYDLRVAEVREAQAELARSHGIHGFVYYHYWFHGRRLLGRPFDEVLASGSPDFPFALCWANEEWTRTWDTRSDEILMPQEYSPEDDLDHIRWLLTAFADPRYIKIDGRPLFLVYRAGRLPDPKATFARWREEAKAAGFPDLYLCFVESWGPPKGGPAAFGLDASVGFMPWGRQRIHHPVEGVHRHRVADYTAILEDEIDRKPVRWKRFPSVMVGWDNTARRPDGATVFEGATPDAYRRWLELAVASVADVPSEENFLFLIAWNEWAEGNHLEPDRRWGRAFLEATRDVLAPPSDPGEPTTTVPPRHDDSVLGRALALLGGLEDGVTVVRPAGVVTPAGGGSPVHHLEVDPDDPASVIEALQALPAAKRRGIVLLDVVTASRAPHVVLDELSRWSASTGGTPVVVTAANVAHFDTALGLLCGTWGPTEAGLLDDRRIRFLTAAMLDHLLERTGWTGVAADDIEAIRSDQYDPVLNDGLPVEMIGALRTLANAANPCSAVTHFVRLLTPTPADRPVADYLTAVTPVGDGTPGRYEDPRATAVRAYLGAAGLSATESNRRAAEYFRARLKGERDGRWKRRLAKRASKSTWLSDTIAAVADRRNR